MVQQSDHDVHVQRDASGAAPRRLLVLPPAQPLLTDTTPLTGHVVPAPPPVLAPEPPVPPAAASAPVSPPVCPLVPPTPASTGTAAPAMTTPVAPTPAVPPPTWDHLGLDDIGLEELAASDAAPRGPGPHRALVAAVVVVTLLVVAGGVWIAWTALSGAGDTGQTVAAIDAVADEPAGVEPGAEAVDVPLPASTPDPDALAAEADADVGADAADPAPATTTPIATPTTGAGADTVRPVGGGVATTAPIDQPAADESPTTTAAPATTAPAAPPADPSTIVLAVDETTSITADLDPETRHRWLVDLPAGAAVAVTVDRADVDGLEDPMVIVEASDGSVVAANDDAGDGFDAAVRFTTTAAGRHDIVVEEAFGLGGRYVLSIETAGSLDELTLAPDAADDGAADDAAVDTGTPIEVSAAPTTHRGELGPGEVDVYTFTAGPGTLVIEMLQDDGAELDPLIVFTDADGRELDRNDDADPNAGLTLFASRLELDIPPGTYRIEARGFGETAGPYTLAVRLVA